MTTQTACAPKPVSASTGVSRPSSSSTGKPIIQRKGRIVSHDLDRMGQKRQRGDLPGEEQHQHKVGLIDGADARRPEGRLRQRPFQQEAQQEGQQQRRDKCHDGPGWRAKGGMEDQRQTDCHEQHEGQGDQLWRRRCRRYRSGWDAPASAGQTRGIPSRMRYSYSYMIQV